MIGLWKRLAALGFLVAAFCALFAMVALAAPDSPAPANATDAAAEESLARMRALAKEEKWRELADQFKDEDLSAWPKAGDAYFYRGRAYLLLKDAANAERDLKASVEHAPKEGYFWYNLGELYRGLLRNPVKAAQAYKKPPRWRTRAVGCLPTRP